jgi:twitching motility protein PilT
VTVFKQRGSLAVAVRLVPTKLPTLEELGIPQAPLKYFCNLKDGLVLVTGATGGGKSTTLASMLRIFNDEYAYHIITVEDPIEYLFKHNKSIIEQRSIPQDAPSFSSALKEALRQNPDVVVVGEIRDDETMRLTLNLAESGILTLATFHTASASDSINRILNFFPGEEEHVRRQLALILRGVFSQQLIPLSAKKGMVPAWEVLIVDERVATLIREGNLHQIDNVIETGSKLGMQSMDQTLISLFKRKLINRKEFLLRVRDKDREEVVKLLSESESLGEEVF